MPGRSLASRTADSLADWLLAYPGVEIIVLIWICRWLMSHAAKLVPWELLRLARDVFDASGCVQGNSNGRIMQIRMKQAARLARDLTRTPRC